MTATRWSLGSRWLRWDPHLHAPGTLRNDQFHGDWDGYVRRIEAAQPAPSALGITDYFTLRGYKEVLRRRQAGALASVALVFPNVELRLTIETKDRQGINLHLIVCPDEADHVARVEEKLAQLRFTYRDDVFPCTDDGLKRLGLAHRNDRALTDEAALAEGANQGAAMKSIGVIKLDKDRSCSADEVIEQFVYDEVEFEAMMQALDPDRLVNRTKRQVLYEAHHQRACGRSEEQVLTKSFWETLGL